MRTQVSSRLVFLTTDSDEFGGAECVRAHIAALADAIAVVHHVALVSDCVEPTGDREGTFRVVSPTTMRPWTAGASWRGLRALRHYLLDQPETAVLAWDYPAAVRAGFATAATNVPVVWSAHSPLNTSSSLRRARRGATLRALTSGGLKVVCPSVALRAHFVQLGAAASQVSVLLNGIDSLRFNNPRPSAAILRRARYDCGIADADLVVACVARIDPVKNHALLFRAVASANLEGVRVSLLCVGGVSSTHEPYALRLRALVDELGLQRQVVWCGQQDDVARWLELCDAAALASEAEVASVALTEAAAAGLPLLATDVGEARAVVVPGETGFLIPHDDADVCAAAFVTLAGDPALRARLGAAAAARARERFDYSVTDGPWQRLLQDLVARSGHDGR